MRQFEKLGCSKCGKTEVLERGKTEVLERPPCTGLLAAGLASVGGSYARMSPTRYEQWAQCLSPTNGSVMLFCLECTAESDSKAIQPSWAELV